MSRWRACLYESGPARPRGARDRTKLAAMSGGVRWAVAIGAAALTLLAAAAPAAARLRWSGCTDVEAECAVLRVPLDRTGGVPGAVRLRVARYSPPSRRPTLLYLSGGPGGAGVQEFSDVLFEVGGLANRFALVSYDQRGTGASGLLRCRTLERDARLRSTAAGEDCAGRLGARRAFYTTRDSVEDVEAVRRELGVEKLTLFGISYGTKLALAYARAHPEHVERIALDSVLEPDDPDAFGREPYQAMGATLAALCPARCRGVTADPAADLARLADRLRAAPLRGVSYGAARPRAPRQADRARAVGPDVRLRLQPGDPRRGAGRRAGGARPWGSRAAAAPDRHGGRALAAPARARVLGRPLRDGVRGDAAAVAARRALRPARPARPRSGGVARPGRVLPVLLRGGQGRRDRPLPALGGGVRAATGRRCLPRGAGARAPGWGGPAHPAGRLRARRGRAGRAAGDRAGSRARGRRWGPVALWHPAPVRVPARAAGRCGLPARADRGARHRRAADLAEPVGRRRVACPAGRGGRWRRSTSRSTTSPSRSHRRWARR